MESNGGGENAKAAASADTEETENAREVYYWE
jgi:hypothetical protein